MGGIYSIKDLANLYLMGELTLCDPHMVIYSIRERIIEEANCIKVELEKEKIKAEFKEKINK